MCDKIPCDNYKTIPGSYEKFLWWNWWFYGIHRKQSNRFCCDCIKNGRNIYSEETIKNRNK